GEDVDAAQIRIQALEKGNVNDAVDSAEGHRRLGAVASQRIKTLPSATCQKNPESIFHHHPSDSVPAAHAAESCFPHGRCGKKTVDGSTGARGAAASGGFANPYNGARCG